MGRLVVLVTSPRVPAGLLSWSAWTALRDATLIVAADPGSPLASALRAEGLVVTPAEASASGLLRLAGDHLVVWLASDDVDDVLMHQLAAQLVAGAERASHPPDLEVLTGSFDPVGARLLDLVEVMDRLRAECPWDRRQTHESLVQYLVEETYETVEAIETGDRDHLREELGDLLLQVVFHARLAEEHDSEPFGIDHVAAGIVDKLIHRHPHVFAVAPIPAGDDGPDTRSAEGVQSQWDQIKAAEKSRTSVLDGIPPGLPALALADKLLGRTSGVTPTRVGVQPEPAGRAASPPRTEETLGEALFALVAEAHSAGIDPEQALRARVRRAMAQVHDNEQRATPATAREPG